MVVCGFNSLSQHDLLSIDQFRQFRQIDNFALTKNI